MDLTVFTGNVVMRNYVFKRQRQRKTKQMCIFIFRSDQGRINLPYVTSCFSINGKLHSQEYAVMCVCPLKQPIAPPE